VFAPASSEFFFAGRGQGATRNDITLAGDLRHRDGFFRMPARNLWSSG